MSGDRRERRGRGAGDRPRGHAPWAAGRRDRYRDYVLSEAYRRERPQKARVIARICREELREADRVADLGSGTGIVRKELEGITSSTIVGFEIDRSFIEEKERTAVADVTRLPLADGSLDFAVLNHLYEHVRDQAGLFRELHRVLAPGGAAYVSAGSRWAVVEPHYRLPFLSWLPRPLADRYLRWAGKGQAYRGIRFRGWWSLTRLMREAGLRVEDRTLRTLDEQLPRTWGPRWARAWRWVRRLPEALVERLLRALSPQWFFVLHRPEGPAAGSADDAPRRDGARPGPAGRGDDRGAGEGPRGRTAHELGGRGR